MLLQDEEMKIQDIEITGIACDSRKVSPGSVFVAIKGVSQDGHRFIDEAINNGAAVIVHQSPVSSVQSRKKCLFVQVDDTRKALGRMAAQFYGNPSERMKVIGVTGTNGKTTITYLIESILARAGFNPAVIGTINYRFNGKVFPSGNTTPGPIDIQSLLADMLKGNVDYAVMEVSSHSLDQDRVEGVEFSHAIFTNLTQDHLDYHGTIDNYFRAKAALFKGLAQSSVSIINNDSPYAKDIISLTRSRVLTFGFAKGCDVYASDINIGASGTSFVAHTPRGEFNINTALIGRHNVYNLLASIALGVSKELKADVISAAIRDFKLVPGRLERIDAGQDFFVFVDYAHTDDALTNVITALRELSKKRIIVVFGCGGDRDKTKRPKMGKVVSELADFAIVTSDNPRSEEPDDIIKDILKGIDKDNYKIVQEREAAIKEALSMARSGDIILIAGKGHETYQISKGKSMPFDDREVVRRCLTSMNY
jgi:UDP-N-acetylmuramoyl-L-alanyl-D-glutamate--2,6-diaminopimelate ligase